MYFEGHFCLLKVKFNTVTDLVNRRGILIIVSKAMKVMSFQKSQGRFLHLLETSGEVGEIYPIFLVFNYLENDRTQENDFPGRTHFLLKQILQKMWNFALWGRSLLTPFSIFLPQHFPSLLYFLHISIFFSLFSFVNIGSIVNMLVF